MPSLRMKEKDSIKCKEWERRRREKINDAFKNLSQLLPNYDPAKNIAKIDVLEKSTEFVKELRLSNSRLLSQQAERDEKCKDNNNNYIDSYINGSCGSGFDLYL